MSKWIDLSLTYLQLNKPCNTSIHKTQIDHAMHCILEGPNSKIGNLYLGNINAANDSKYLHDHQVGAVLSVIDTSDIKLDSSITKMWIMAEDHESFELDRYFDSGTNFIYNNLKTTNVLVHCYAGVSRSASLVLAFLMKHHKLSLKDAFRKVKSVRTQIDPNEGFIKQLKQFELRLQQDSELKTRSGSFHSNPRGSQSTTYYSGKNRPSFLDKNPSQPTVSTFSSRTFFKQQIADDPIKKFQKQKNLENLWQTCLNQTKFDVVLQSNLQQNKPLSKFSSRHNSMINMNI